MSINVEKRDGTLQPLDIEKTQKMAEFAVEGTNCSSLELQSSLHFSLRDGIKTSFVHSQMTYEAINKISYEKPQWRIVAGRLKMIEDIKAKTVRARVENKDFNFYKSEFTDFLDLMKENYDMEWFNGISNDTLNEMWKEYVDLNKNFNYFIESVITLENKFLIDLETPQHLYFIISLIYAKQYAKKNQIFLNSQEFKDKVKDYYNLTSNRKVSFPSVILSELRKKDANLASCFIGKIPDNIDSEIDQEEVVKFIKEFIDENNSSETAVKLYELIKNDEFRKNGIMDYIKDFALISKNGGGIGVNLDDIRAFSSWLMGKKGRATGVKPLMKVLNDLMIYINQSGVKDGAMTVALSAWHMDVFDFLKTQQIGGEEREKSMDLFLQIIANDKFMEAMDKDENWILFDPYEIKKKYNISLGESHSDKFNDNYEFLLSERKAGNIELSSEVRAKDIFKEMLRTMINRGTPYVFFKDNVNRVSNMKDAGTIHNGNLCVESYSIFDVDTTHTCNLLSLVSPMIESDEDLENTINLGMEILDFTIDISKPPTKASQKHNDEIRAVGLGNLGLADWVALNNANYETEEGQKKISILFEKIAYYSIKKSAEMGQQYGSFGRFKESEWAKGNLIGKELSEIIANSQTDLDWSSLSELVKIAMRNGWLLAIAPNTTSSSAIGVSSSILPTYSKFFMEETKSGNVPRMPLFIEERPMGYKEYRHINMIKMNSCVSKIQFWTDTGISYEPLFDLNDPENRKVKTIFNFYIDAWKKGIKCIYYIRWIKPGQQDAESKAECVSCAG